MAKSKSPALKMNDARREIAVKALLQHALKDRYVEMAKRERGIFDAAYAKFIKPEERELMAKLPDGFFREERSLYVRASQMGWDTTVTAVKPDSITVGYNSWRRGDWHLAVGREWDDFRMPYNGRNDRLVFDGEEGERLQAYMMDSKRLDEEAKKLLVQLISTIAGFRQVDDLIEAIPELKELAPGLYEVVEKQQALIPSVQGVMCKIAALRGEERAGCAEMSQAA